MESNKDIKQIYVELSKITSGRIVVPATTTSSNPSTKGTSTKGK